MNEARHIEPKPAFDTPDPARPAKAAVRAVTAPIDAPAPWLANIATLALHLLPQRAVALASVAVRSTDASGWSPLAIGVGGTSDAELARRIERTTRLSSELGNRRGPFVDSDAPDSPAVTRFVAADNAAITMCAYLGARFDMGLHGLLRVSVRVPVAPPHLLLVIQGDGLDPDWAPSDGHADAVAQYAEAVAIGYATRFVATQRLQESLLDRLSDTQRRIVPLLIEEKSEREIADALRRSRHTIHEHVKAIYQSWGVHSRHQAREAWLGRQTTR